MARRRYRTVESMDNEDRKRVVLDIFSTFHRTYDIANRLLSLRRDVAWRRRALRFMAFDATKRLLDVATGTADLAIMAARVFPAIEVEGVDIAAPMLEIGKAKTRAAGLEGRVHLSCADALHLPFPPASFDVASIAFGMRNIPEMARALSEMLRVTVPGGLVLILEMSEAVVFPLGAIYHFYLHRILPALGRLIAGDGAAYLYLAESIARHPHPAVFGLLMETAGFVDVEYRRLTWGAAYLHIGRVPVAGKAC